MKVFDFDNTIYRGESPIDFTFYMIRYNKKIIRYIPVILFTLIGYKLCLLKKEKLESVINDFFVGVIDDSQPQDEFIKRFWDSHSHKLYKDMLALIGPGDVIISASPAYTLSFVRGFLNTENIIGTEIDYEKKKITWLNFGDNKVKRYKELYGDREIDAFYTDSYNDKYMMELAREVYIVKKGKPKKIK